MSKNKQDLKNIANQWFTWYEGNSYTPRNTINHQINQVFDFCDYINSLPDWHIAAELETEDLSDVKNFREMINNGIDYWLGDLIKSIYIH